LNIYDLNPKIIKNLTTILLVLVTLNLFAQESFEQATDLQWASSNETNVVEAFSPNRKLLNAELWKRVSVNRFECGFLRLAVELKNYEYVLIEMDGNKRILAQDEQYSVISRAIVRLTLNSTPNLTGFSNSTNI
jgi:hypothetical protein